MTSRAGHAFLLIVLMVMVSSCERTATPTGPFSLRVDAGNQAAYRDQDGNVWEPDCDYRGSATYGFVGYGGGIADRGWNARIEGTKEPRLYQTEHWGMNEFVAEVPDGRYSVALHFSETFLGIQEEGPRVFDVEIEGEKVLTDFDVMKEAGGMQKAIVRRFRDIPVDDGTLTIKFIPKRQNPSIDAIEIVKE